MLINERKIREGLVTRDCPLECFFGFSNEWRPEGCEQTTAAFFDRFLIRKEVLPIRTPAGRRRLRTLGEISPADVTARLTRDNLAVVRQEAMALPWSMEAAQALETIDAALAAEGIFPGDRRTKKAVKVARAAAYLEGASQVLPEHLECLRHVLWVDEREQPGKCADVVLKVANPVGQQVGALQAEADAIIQSFDPRNAATGATCIKKLREIHETLSKIGGNGRAKKTMEYVAAEGRRIKATFVENI